MLLLGDRLLHSPVLGLHTGGELARTEETVIDPSNLKIVAYELSGPLLDLHPSFLLVDDIREISNIGIIIDSSDELVTSNDIVRLDKVYELHFKLLGMPVIDQKKRKLGKVYNYSLNTADFLIQQLSIKRPLFKSLSDTELLIHRNQITEINNQCIIVKSEDESTPEPLINTANSSYVNPFRTTKPVPEQSSN